MTIWICDVHGVLVDTPALVREAFAATATRFGLSFTAGHWQRMKGLPLLHAYRELGGCDETAALVRRQYHVDYLRERIAGVQSYRGVAGMLRAARAAGVRIGAATSNGEIAEACLVRTGLYSLLDCLVTQEEVRQAKPHPESLFRVIALLSAGAEAIQASVLFVGDTTVDIRAGQAAGVTTVGVTYGASAAMELAAGSPDHLIDHFEDMRRFLPDRPAAPVLVHDSTGVS